MRDQSGAQFPKHLKRKPKSPKFQHNDFFFLNKLSGNLKREYLSSNTNRLVGRPLFAFAQNIVVVFFEL